MVKDIFIIPPIYHINKFMSDIKAKCKLFNSYIEGQCLPLVNNSKLPTRFTVHTDSVLTSIDFSVEQVTSIIKKLDPNKAHGHGKKSYIYAETMWRFNKKSLATIF